tara:strand:+ start:284 stop:451 length:168 start_codon:yes stop_codon:yes gene_type:complete
MLHNHHWDQPSQSFHIKISPKGELYVLADDDMDAAYKAKDLADLLNAKLVDVFPL